MTNLASLDIEQSITHQKVKKNKKNRKGYMSNGGNVKSSEADEDEIAWRHVIFWQFLGVCLPTFDVYSDIAYMIVNLLQFYPLESDFEIPLGGNCTDEKYGNVSYCKLSYSEQFFAQCRQQHYITGRSSAVSCGYVEGLSYSMSIPLLMNFGFTARYWWIDYKSKKTKKWTILLLILQLYPQYRIIDFLRHKNPNHKEWQKKMKEWESGVGLLEPYLESILQVLFTFNILTSVKGFAFKNSYRFFSPNIFKTTTFAVLTFTSSCLSATYGIGKFFITSRLRVVKEWSIGGVLLFTCFSSTFILRLLYTEMVFFAFNYNTGWFSNKLVPRLAIYLVWGLPSFILNLRRLFATGGVEKTLKLLSFYPQVMLAPCFIFFTFEWYEDISHEQSSDTDENKNTTNKTVQKSDHIKVDIKDVRKRAGFRVWTFGSLINAVYMILLPSIFIIFTKPIDGLVPWDVAPEYKGLIAFLIYVFPVYIVLAALMALHFYGHVLFNSLFFRNSYLEKYIKEAHSFDPDDLEST